MKTKLCILLFFLFQLSFCQQNYLKTWATYYGDESVVVKDSEIDSMGNVYIVGKVQYNPLAAYVIATFDAHQTNFGGGEADGFITKFNSDGDVIWSTYYGGENFDRIDDISIDKYNNIYCIGGTFSTQNIAGINSYQPNLAGNSDTFIVKLSPIGEVLWNTYFGGIGNETGIELNEYNSGNSIINDELGNFYFFSQTDSNSLSTTGVFQENRNDAKSIIAKFSDDGNRLWCTYYGINNSKIKSIDIGRTGIFVSGLTIDCAPFTPNTYFATSNCHQSSASSCSDTFISKFSFDGQRIWSTYYGGSSTERLNSNGLKCNNGFIYFSGLGTSNFNITTPNSFQPTKNSTTYSNYLVKFNEAGERLWGTYVGENSTAGILEPISAKIKIHLSNIYLYGATVLTENISTPNAFQPNINEYYEGYMVKFNENGSREWGSYFGANNVDEVKNILFNSDSFYLVGKTQSQTGITTTGVLQPNFLYNNSPWAALTTANTFVAKFDPNLLAIQAPSDSNFSVFPNPSDGIVFMENKLNIPIEEVILTDSIGNIISKKDTDLSKLNLVNYNPGFYILIIRTGLKRICFKIIKK
jgi:hypothetical protein